MKTVAELIKELQAFPPDSKVHAYEGEAIGLTVYNPAGDREIGFIDVSPS